VQVNECHSRKEREQEGNPVGTGQTSELSVAGGAPREASGDHCYRRHPQALASKGPRFAALRRYF